MSMKVLVLDGVKKTPRLAHNFARDENDWYVEPQWCSQRLFEEEQFTGEVWDPCCGWGRIVRSALDVGYSVKASDIIIRPSGDAAIDKLKYQADFRDCAGPAINIACNPPYRVLPTYTQRALKLAQRKVAVIFPIARLNAAHWIMGAPLLRIWLMSPRPPMPHSRFGGSVAARVLRCPASVGLVERVPEHLRRSSAYAARGTALHAAMALLLGDAPPPLERLVGETISDYTITADDVETALRPVYSNVEALLDAPGAGYYLEHRVVFPTIVGAFGTIDLLVRIGSVAYVIDAKFGAGVRVLALYPDGDDDILNAQLMFYAAAARHSLPIFFAGVENIVLTILQPVSVEPGANMVSSIAVTHAELDEFIAVYRGACTEALSGTPRRARGDHCRFCPARPICPEHTGPLLDLAQFMVPTSGVFAASASKEGYLQLLADGLNLVEAIKDIRTALHDQAKRALESGDTVPGYTLTAGRAERRWRDESAVIAALGRLGLTRDDVVAETMRSVKQVELRAKARGLKIPQELIGSHSSGTSLAKCENARAPVRGRDEIVRSFSAALNASQEVGIS
jgi:Protein of unknown function (DUF2800)